MYLVWLAALTAVCSAENLGRGYLPPAFAKTVGDGLSLSSTPFPDYYRGPAGSYSNDAQGIVVDAASPGTRTSIGTEESGLGAPRTSYGSTASKVGEAAFKDSLTGSNKSPTLFKSIPLEEQDPEYQTSIPKQEAIQTKLLLPQDNDHKSNIVTYENNVDKNNYGFESDNGIAVGEKGVAHDRVHSQGAYSYEGDSGKVYKVIYKVDKAGYQSQGKDFPIPEPVFEDIQKAIEKNKKEEAAGAVVSGSYDSQKYNAGGDYKESDTNKYQTQQSQFEKRPEYDASVNGASLVEYNVPTSGLTGSSGSTSGSSVYKPTTAFPTGSPSVFNSQSKPSTANDQALLGNSPSFSQFLQGSSLKFPTQPTFFGTQFTQQGLKPQFGSTASPSFGQLSTTQPGQLESKYNSQTFHKPELNFASGEMSSQHIKDTQVFSSIPKGDQYSQGHKDSQLNSYLVSSVAPSPSKPTILEQNLNSKPSGSSLESTSSTFGQEGQTGSLGNAYLPPSLNKGYEKPLYSVPPQESSISTTPITSTKNPAVISVSTNPQDNQLNLQTSFVSSSVTPSGPKPTLGFQTPEVSNLYQQPSNIQPTTATQTTNNKFPSSQGQVSLNQSNQKYPDQSGSQDPQQQKPFIASQYPSSNSILSTQTAFNQSPSGSTPTIGQASQFDNQFNKTPVKTQTYSPTSPSFTTSNSVSYKPVSASPTTALQQITDKDKFTQSTTSTEHKIQSESRPSITQNVISTQLPLSSQQVQGVDHSYYYNQPSKPFSTPATSSQVSSFPLSSSSQYLESNQYSKPSQPSYTSVSQEAAAQFPSQTPTLPTSFPQKPTQQSFSQSTFVHKPQLGQTSFITSPVSNKPFVNYTPQPSPTQQYTGELYDYKKPTQGLSANKDSGTSEQKPKDGQIQSGGTSTQELQQSHKETVPQLDLTKPQVGQILLPQQGNVQSSNTPATSQEQSKPVYTQFGTQSYKPLGSGPQFGTQPYKPFSTVTQFGTQPFKPYGSTTSFGAQSYRPFGTTTQFGNQPVKAGASSFQFSRQPTKPFGSTSYFGTQQAKPSGSTVQFGHQQVKPSGNTFQFGTQQAKPSESTSQFGIQKAKPSESAFQFGTQQAKPSESTLQLGTQQTKPSRDSFLIGTQQAKPSESTLQLGTQQAKPSGGSFLTDTQQAKPSGGSFLIGTQQAKPSGGSFLIGTQQAKPSGGSFLIDTQQAKPPGGSFLIGTQKAKPSESTLQLGAQQAKPSGGSFLIGTQEAKPSESTLQFGTQQAKPSGGSFLIGTQKAKPSESTLQLGAQQAKPSGGSFLIGTQEAKPSESTLQFGTQQAKPSGGSFLIGTQQAKPSESTLQLGTQQAKPSESTLQLGTQEAKPSGGSFLIGTQQAKPSESTLQLGTQQAKPSGGSFLIGTQQAKQSESTLALGTQQAKPSGGSFLVGTQQAKPSEGSFQIGTQETKPCDSDLLFGTPSYKPQVSQPQQLPHGKPQPNTIIFTQSGSQPVKPISNIPLITTSQTQIGGQTTKPQFSPQGQNYNAGTVSTSQFGTQPQVSQPTFGTLLTSSKVQSSENQQSVIQPVEPLTSQTGEQQGIQQQYLIQSKPQFSQTYLTTSKKPEQSVPQTQFVTSTYKPFVVVPSSSSGSLLTQTQSGTQATKPYETLEKGGSINTGAFNVVSSVPTIQETVQTTNSQSSKTQFSGESSKPVKVTQTQQQQTTNYQFGAQSKPQFSQTYLTTSKKSEQSVPQTQFVTSTYKPFVVVPSSSSGSLLTQTQSGTQATKPYETLEKGGSINTGAFNVVSSVPTIQETVQTTNSQSSKTQFSSESSKPVKVTQTQQQQTTNYQFGAQSKPQFPLSQQISSNVPQQPYVNNAFGSQSYNTFESSTPYNFGAQQTKDQFGQNNFPDFDGAHATASASSQSFPGPQFGSQPFDNVFKSQFGQNFPPPQSTAFASATSGPGPYEYNKPTPQPFIKFSSQPGKYFGGVSTPVFPSVQPQFVQSTTPSYTQKLSSFDSAQGLSTFGQSPYPQFNSQTIKPLSVTQVGVIPQALPSKPQSSLEAACCKATQSAPTNQGPLYGSSATPTIQSTIHGQAPQTLTIQGQLKPVERPIKGEKFDGPKQPQRFDEKTGYHY